MSALRLAPGVYRDPYSGATLEVGVVVPLPIVPAGPVERRKATPEELARLTPPEPVVEAPPPVVRPARVVVRVARAARPVRAPKPRRVVVKAEPRRKNMPQHASDVAVVWALREAKGNAAKASRILDLSDTAVRQRVETLRKWGLLPADVDAMFSARKRGAR